MMKGNVSVMKIAMIFDGLGWGGTERVGIDYVRIMKELGCDVDVYNLIPSLMQWNQIFLPMLILFIIIFLVFCHLKRIAEYYIKPVFVEYSFILQCILLVQ